MSHLLLQRLVSAKPRSFLADGDRAPYSTVTIEDATGFRAELFFAGADAAQSVADAINAAIAAEVGC